ncbi:MAG: hypothetical protein K5666_00575, partial [Bacilli bacterium]|nr:hypothetical protein [Bacilli bacterium]
LLLPVFYRNICVDIKKKFIYWLFIIVVSISSTVLCVNSYFDLHDMKMRVNPNEAITNYLKEKGYKNGFRTTNAEHNIFYMFSEGKVRMINLSSKKGKYNMYHWLESKNWINELPKNEKVFYLDETDYNSLCFVIESMAMEYDEYDGYSIYVFENYDSMMFALRENYKYNKRMGLIPKQED